MSINGIQIDDSDVDILKTMIINYQELNDTIYDLQKQLNEIQVKKQAISEKLTLLKETELEFIEQLKKKYNNDFNTNELLKIIIESDYESGNMRNC